MPDFEKVMQEIHAANAEHGVEVRGGKKYLEVSKRVEVFRKNFGDIPGIETTIEHLGMVRGEPIVMRAIITDANGRTIATGHAWEVIGAGNVNQSSALENAETSAIGRALAALGLHGGEYASLNELRKDKPDNPTAEGLEDAWEQAVLDRLQDDPSAEALAEGYAEQIQSDIGRYKSPNGIDGYMRKRAQQIRFIEEHAPEMFGQVRAAVLAQREIINGKVTQ